MDERQGAAKRERGRILVFAKAPAPGAVKTRLAATLGAEQAACLARAFLRDTWSLLQSAAGDLAEPILVLDGDPALIAIEGAEIWAQGGGDLGERLTRGLGRALEGGPWVIAIGADSPGMPGALLRQAIQTMQNERAESLLAPAADGGFVMLGLRRLPSDLLADLPWSEPTTFNATLARLRARGLEPAVLDPWFDIDLPEDLVRLEALLARGEVTAPATASAIASLRRTACSSQS